MKNRKFGLLQIIFTVLIAVVLIRFLPFILRAAQMIVLAVRPFWWAVLPAVICAWVVWKAKSRNRVSGRAEPLLEDQPRDVTGSIKETT